MDLRALLDVWLSGSALDGGDDEPACSLEALEANAAMVEVLTSFRWQAILVAMEAGADWDDVADALGTTRGGAWRLFCQQTDVLGPGEEVLRAATIRDPLRRSFYR